MNLKSLKTQIVLVSSATVILLTVITTLIFALQQQRIYLGQYSSNASQISQEIQDELLSSIDTVQQQLRFMATLPTFQNLTRAEESSDIQSETDRTLIQMLQISYVVLRAAIGSNTDYYSVSVVHGSSGMELQRLEKSDNHSIEIPIQEPFNFSDSDYFQEIRLLENDELYISPIMHYQDASGVANSEQPVLLLATPLLDAEGGFIGAIIVTVDLASIFQRVNRIAASQTLAEGLDVYLGDETGEYLYHLDPETRFNLSANGEGSWQNDFMQATTTDTSANRIFPGLGVQGLDLLQVDLGGQRVFAQLSQFSLSSVPGSPAISQIITIPAEVVNEQVLPVVISTVALVALGGIAVTFVFAWYALRQLAPLTALSESAERIADGNYDTLIPHSGITEIKNLSDSLKYLQLEVDKRERNLQVSERNLREHQNELENKVTQRTVELMSARDEANRLVKVKSDFLANMSHEIRTPMTAILGLLGILQSSNLTTQQRQYFNQIRSSSEALLNIINDILDISKIEAGKIMIEEAAFSLLKTLEGSVELFAPSADLKALNLYLKIDPAIDTHVAGDRTRLAQVLHNLIGNAIKFTNRGDITVGVQLLRETDLSVQVQISVEDSGIGISEDAQQRLFEAFEQAEAATTREYGGTGLGLTISQKLVQLMGSELKLESSKGEGSRFWFDIEFKKRDQLEQLLVEPHCELDILVVDDQPVSCEILHTMLSAWGCRVQSVYTAELALEKLEAAAGIEQPFDLVIIDWRLPGIDGLELASRIRAFQQTGKQMCRALIMHTEADRTEIMQAANYQEDLEVLLKPVTMSRLLSVFVDQGLVELVREEADIAEPRDGAEHLRAAIEALGSPGEILLVEDNLTNQVVIRELLAGHNLNISLASNGHVAVEMVELRDFDVVLMDLQMPVMDGFEATRAIRQKKGLRELPVLALSAAIFTEDVQQASRAGMNDHLVKPIDVEKLLKALSKWLPIGREAIASKQVLSSSTDPVRADDAAQSAQLDILERLQQESDFELAGTILQQIGAAGALRVLHSFVKEFSETVDRWERGELNDNDELARLAHTINGAAANIGAVQLANRAKEVEAGIRNKDSDGIETLITELRKILDKLRLLIDS